MKSLRIALIAAVLGCGPAWAQQAAPASRPSGEADARYVKSVEPRFGSFAGSSANLDSLATGLRHGTAVTLTGNGQTVKFTPPTRPMGYGNVTRGFDLANRELAALGIANPTPQQISAAMMGGTVNTANGPVVLRGVLQLRAQGMGWGRIAHTIGVPPNEHAHIAGTAATGVTTASGRAPGGVVTAGGKSSAGRGIPQSGNVAAQSGLSTAANAAGGAGATSNGHGVGRGRF